MKEKEKNDPSKESRRSFLNRIWILLGGLACLEFGWLGITTLSSHQKRQQEEEQETIVIAGKMEEFQPNTVSTISQGQFYLACLEDGSFLAISRTCTHLGCSVPWDEGLHKFICPCHGSTFNLKGEVLSAPAPRPLDIFPVRIENKIVKVNISRPQRRDHFVPTQATRLS